MGAKRVGLVGVVGRVDEGVGLDVLEWVSFAGPSSRAAWVDVECSSVVFGNTIPLMVGSRRLSKLRGRCSDIARLRCLLAVHGCA